MPIQSWAPCPSRRSTSRWSCVCLSRFGRKSPRRPNASEGASRRVLDWAKVRRYREGENPARWRGHMDKLLPARSKVRAVKHHAALPYMEIAAFIAALREREAIALEF